MSNETARALRWAGEFVREHLTAGELTKNAGK